MKKRIFSLVLALIVMCSFVETISASVITANYASEMRHVQSDSKWNIKDEDKYGGGTLRDTGCGIFALVNAVYALTGKNMGVKKVAEWAHSINAYNPGKSDVGTDRSLLYPKVTAKYGSKYGFKFENSGKGYWESASSSRLKKHLKTGGVAIGHVPGHFIALVGYNTTNGKILVFDSYPTRARGTTRNGDWKTVSQLSSGALKLDWFSLISRTVKPGCFPSCASGYNNLADALKSIGEDSSFNYRSKIAAVNGFPGYKGASTEETALLSLFRAGDLKKPKK